MLIQEFWEFIEFFYIFWIIVRMNDLLRFLGTRKGHPYRGIYDILMHTNYIINMRTTIRIDDNLLTLAKKAALDSKSTLTAIIEEALREKLFRRKEILEPAAVSILTFKGEGLLPGVDLDDSSSLLELLES